MYRANLDDACFPCGIDSQPEEGVAGLPTNRGPKRALAMKSELSEVATNILMAQLTQKWVSLTHMERANNTF
jgi:hypothetical protein